MQLNTSYLNRTPNKTARNTTNFIPEFVVMHETAGYGALEWNLRPEVRSSYNYLITRDGTVYHYVDEKRYVSWHAGVSSAARGYTGGQLNTYAMGVELEGPNDGTPITTKQTKSMIELLTYFRDEYGIPLTRDYYFGHKDVSPSYKIDPKGYSVEYTLKIISDLAPPVDVRSDSLHDALLNSAYQLAGGEYRPDWAFHQYALENNLGMPIKISMDFTTQGIRYTGEVYGSDIIISPYGKWNIVLRSNELTDNAIYNDLLSFAYGALGVTYRAEQAFAHFTRSTPIGLPLIESQRMNIPSGEAFATQIYTLDTLFTPISLQGATDWSIVRQLSVVIAMENIAAAEAALQEVIYSSMYDRVKYKYDPNLAFIKKAFQDQLGAPLSGERRLIYKNVEYIYVVYALDLLYARADEPKKVKRLADLRTQQHA